MTLGVQIRTSHLRTVGRSPGELSISERQAMYRLMSSHFDDVDPVVFDRDLLEKDWIVTISERDQGILGFTTAMRLEAQIDDENVVALFSGDTVLDLSIWGVSSWMRVLAEYAEREIQTTPGPVYWLLLTATHRTYRVLPALFHEFYPRPSRDIPAAIKRRRDALVRIKFAEEYDNVAGTIHLKRPTPVRVNRRAIAAKGRSNSHSRFFAAQNPQFLNGDYLACIADLSPSNRTIAGQRLFGMSQAKDEST